jgi:hypothetical protein
MTDMSHKRAEQPSLHAAAEADFTNWREEQLALRAEAEQHVRASVLGDGIVDKTGAPAA